MPMPLAQAQAHIKSLLAGGQRVGATTQPARVTPTSQLQAQMRLRSMQDSARAAGTQAWQQQQTQTQAQTDAQTQAQRQSDAAFAAQQAALRAQQAYLAHQQAVSQAQAVGVAPAAFAAQHAAMTGLPSSTSVVPGTAQSVDAIPTQGMSLPNGVRQSMSSPGGYEVWNQDSNSWIPWNGSLQDIFNTYGPGAQPSSFATPATVASTTPSVMTKPKLENPTVNATTQSNANPIARGSVFNTSPFPVQPTTTRPSAIPDTWNSPNTAPTPATSVAGSPPAGLAATTPSGFSTASSFGPAAMVPTNANPGGYSWANDNKFLQGYASTATRGAGTNADVQYNNYVSAFGQPSWTPSG